MTSVKSSYTSHEPVSGCDDPTERLSSFIDRLLQQIAQKQDSHLKYKKDFINLVENKRVQKQLF